MTHQWNSFSNLVWNGCTGVFRKLKRHTGITIILNQILYFQMWWINTWADLKKKKKSLALELRLHFIIFLKNKKKKIKLEFSYPCISFWFTTCVKILQSLFSGMVSKWNFTAAVKFISYGLVCASLDFKVAVRVTQHRSELEVIDHSLEVRFSLRILENIVAQCVYHINTAANDCIYIFRLLS